MAHQHCYYDILKKITPNEPPDFDSDVYLIRLHLHFDYALTDLDAFNRYFKFVILGVVNPGDIEKKEFKLKWLS